MTAAVLRLKGTLDDVEPKVLRRIEVPADIKLDRLHLTLQAALDWTNSHLFEIRARDVGWGLPSPDWPDGPLDARKVKLIDVLEDAGTKTLASGTHRHWDFPLDNGGTAPLAFHVYPRSSGRVLRVIGKAIEEACEMVTGRDLQALRDLKRQLYGPHHSELPGWKPLWKRQREAAAAAK